MAELHFQVTFSLQKHIIKIFCKDVKRNASTILNLLHEYDQILDQHSSP